MARLKLVHVPPEVPKLVVTETGENVFDALDVTKMTVEWNGPTPLPKITLELDLADVESIEVEADGSPFPANRKGGGSNP